MEFQEWDDRLKMADDKGTLVYIQNLDIRFGPADIEVASSILSFWLSNKAQCTSPLVLCLAYYFSTICGHLLLSLRLQFYFCARNL
jgi:hypothetical protein